MATEQFANSASSTLNGAIISSDTSLVVTAATSFPSIPQFRILIDSEIILVTAVAGTTFTISRAQEGTTAAGHSNGATITHILTAGALSQYRDDVQLAKVLSGVTSNTTIVQTNEIVSIGTLSGAITITLPASPATGRSTRSRTPTAALASSTSRSRATARTSTALRPS